MDMRRVVIIGIDRDSEISAAAEHLAHVVTLSG
jgi:hypothetical protein